MERVSLLAGDPSTVSASSTKDNLQEGAYWTRHLSGMTKGIVFSY
jgi:hypothetical protein